MKLKIEFEEEDLRDMIHGYFNNRGFVVKNMDDLVQMFNEAFPEGIVVAAEPTVTPPIKWEPKDIIEEALNLPEAPEEDNVNEVKGDPEAPLSMTDLMDPQKRLPDDRTTKDETERELQHILKQSRDLEEQR